MKTRLSSFFFFVFLLQVFSLPPANAHGECDNVKRVVERTSGGNLGKQDLFITSDFDNNGIMDSAFFVAENGYFSLCVSLNDGKRGVKLRDLDTVDYYGIRIATPGVYVNACSRGYGSGCRSNEVKKVNLTAQSIDFFKYESSSFLYYWHKNRFQLLPLAD